MVNGVIGYYFLRIIYKPSIIKYQQVDLSEQETYLSSNFALIMKFIDEACKTRIMDGELLHVEA